jgi:hypothetical protein
MAVGWNSSKICRLILQAAALFVFQVRDRPLHHQAA